MHPTIDPLPATSQPGRAPSLPWAGLGDRRAGERTPLRRGAMLELPGRRRLAVNLLDLSLGGAAVLDHGIGATMGATGALMLDTALMPVTVVAVSEDRLHLAFLPMAPEAESVLRRLLGAMADGARAG